MNPATIRFRTQPATSTALRVDRAARTITGVSLIELGEAKGHNLLVDQVTLQQCCDQVNALGATGLKSRFTHPGMCADGMGKMLGRISNARVLGNQCVADLKFADAASSGPDGDLATYVMDLAEEDPTSCGLSIVFSGRPVWKLTGGGDIPADPKIGRPKDATTEMPFARIAKLTAADVVDEPAATSGLLAAAFSSTSNLESAEAFARLDELRTSLGLSVAAVHQFAQRYCATRGLTIPSSPVSEPSMDIKQLSAFADANPGFEALILKNGDKTETELAAIIHSAKTESLSKDVQGLRDQLAAAKTSHESALSALKADHEKAITKLSAENRDLKVRLGIKEDAGVEVAALPESGAKTKTEAELRAEFAASPKLQDEFYAGADSYVAFKKAEAKQR